VRLREIGMAGELLCESFDPRGVVEDIDELVLWAVAVVVVDRAGVVRLARWYSRVLRVGRVPVGDRGAELGQLRSGRYRFGGRDGATGSDGFGEALHAPMQRAAEASTTSGLSGRVIVTVGESQSLSACAVLRSATPVRDGDDQPFRDRANSFNCSSVQPLSRHHVCRAKCHRSNRRFAAAPGSSTSSVRLRQRSLLRSKWSRNSGGRTTTRLTPYVDVSRASHAGRPSGYPSCR